MKNIAFPFILLIIFTINHLSAQSVSDTFEGGVSLGLSVPFGEFGAVDGKSPGYSKIGGGVTFDARFILEKKILWVSTFALNINPIDHEAIKNSGKIKLTGNKEYIQTWILTGVGFELGVVPGLTAYANGQLGGFIGQFPEMSYNTKDQSFNFTNDVTFSLAIAINTGLKFDSYYLGLRLLWAEPEYKKSFSNNASNVEFENEEITNSILLFTLGYIF